MKSTFFNKAILVALFATVAAQAGAQVAIVATATPSLWARCVAASKCYANNAWEGLKTVSGKFVSGGKYVYEAAKAHPCYAVAIAFAGYVLYSAIQCPCCRREAMERDREQQAYKELVNQDPSAVPAVQ